ncbi:Hypothetical protein ETEE_2799 [Edwardsiella anguillarum ET080813]|uniref:Uncharacterized protein n=1 Tax=Edwardsiella anguillarum ET080813 TaxID=667120 RepID=A0A076LRC0_9GAMM|nr:Hypothetical protein ETEE_2799 [Edwardsiella anguillarum ET080813]
MITLLENMNILVDDGIRHGSVIKISASFVGLPVVISH